MRPRTSRPEFGGQGGRQPSVIPTTQVGNLVKTLGLHTYAWVDALVQLVREGGRVQNVAVALAAGSNAPWSSIPR